MSETLYNQYAADVKSGKQTAGLYIHQAVDKYYRMMDDVRYEFRPNRVDDVIEFCAALKHFKGSHSGKPFLLSPWQCFAVACIYGFVWKGTNRRVVTSVYIEIARKNGKTAFAAALSLYGLIMDGEDGAEVDLAANSKEQAKIAFQFSEQFSQGLDPKHQVLKPYRDSIRMASTVSQLNVFAADDSKLDGYNASTYILDEYHAAKTSKLFDVLDSSQGMREQPLSFIITTAGFDKTGPCYAKRTNSIEVLSGLKENDSQFDLIYTLDEKDDWRDESVWVKSSPNLGVTVRLDWLRDQIKKAQQDASKEVGVKTKVLNVWCDSSEVWIPSSYINATMRDIPLEEFRDKDVYMGIDLSATSDLTCLTAMYLKDDGTPVFKTFYYLPEQAVATEEQMAKFLAWKRRGLMTLTPGNVTDYDYVLNQIMKFNEICNILFIAYDQWNATQFVLSAQEQGLPMQQYSQTIGNFNKPTKGLERLILSKRVEIDNNEITRWCFNNVKIKRDWNGNEKPSKDDAANKIDGVITIIESLGVYMDTPTYSVTLE